MFAQSPHGWVHGVPDKPSPQPRLRLTTELNPFMNDARGPERCGMAGGVAFGGMAPFGPLYFRQRLPRRPCLPSSPHHCAILTVSPVVHHQRRLALAVATKDFGRWHHAHTVGLEPLR